MIKASDQLVNALNNRTATIGVVGLGYVGLPLVIRYVQEGYKVIGFDIDDAKVNKLNEGMSYIEHIPSSLIKDGIKNGKMRATTEFKLASEVDALVICVPTPLNKYREPDLSYVTGTMDMLCPHLRKGQVVSLESTTYPGTTEEELLPRMERCGFKVGTDIFLVFSPEREDPGRIDFNTKTTPEVCGGITEECLRVGVALYASAVDTVVPVSSAKVAEMTKLLENIHRAVNIGLVNEMKIVADRMGIDIHEVIRAAATKPFGFVAYEPGPGIGGHCIPIDPFYLTWKAREFGVNTRFIELAGEVNSRMPEYVVLKISEALNEQEKSLRGSRILILGIAYKKDVDDVRESPSVYIMEILRSKGVVVSYSDPHVPAFPKMREHSFDLKSVELNAENIQNYDCIVIATNHSRFDYDLLLENAKCIVDCRGHYPAHTKKVVKA